ncbi:class I SAM-dependent methyltransferase [Ancylobacter sp. IITR112]|uniref:class I SAM-dependent methyltransferase n=1 Tax=Ancylobacter sp. IITR112 TaxID=3138073 RepID=UPI00352A5EA8
MLAARNPAAAYLEIGCFRNDLFDSLPLASKIGVDPVQGGTVRATSDEFFATNTQKFDLIFIDGLHTYEQVHRDVANALKVVNPGGWIAMHDMLPSSVMGQHEPHPEIGAWVGGGWKVGFELLQTQGVDFKIVKIDHGVGVIRVTNPGAALADLSGELAGPRFPYFYENYTRLPLVTWEEALPWLRTA